MCVAGLSCDLHGAVCVQCVHGVTQEQRACFVYVWLFFVAAFFQKECIPVIYVFHESMRERYGTLYKM